MHDFFFLEETVPGVPRVKDALRHDTLFGGIVTNAKRMH